MEWTQLWVRGAHATPASIKPIDAYLQTLGAVFYAPDDLPIHQAADGTWEIRVYGPSVGFIKFVLEDRYQLEIVREETYAG